MLTTTVLSSFVVPVKVGVEVSDHDAGVLMVNFGAAVSTSNVTGALLPAGLPSELGWVAIAV